LEFFSQPQNKLLFCTLHAKNDEIGTWTAKMLIEFRVRNYRSIRDEQRLSLVASSDKSHADTNLVKTGIKALPDLVRSAVIYGPNASGKSNLINALAVCVSIVASSATQMQLGQAFPVQPFRLDETSPGEPSEFELTFVHEGVRYQYGFALTAARVVDEWLLVYRTAKPQEWFTRRFDPDTNRDEFTFGSHLSGQRKLWQDSTRPNALFLSTAVHLNSEQLRPVFESITTKLVILGTGMQPTNDYSVTMLRDEDGRQAIKRFLAAADVGIADVEATPRKMMQFKMVMGATTAGTPGLPEFRPTEQDMLVPTFLHQTDTGSVRFDIHEESTGTQRLFAFAGPILNILAAGSALIVDELDNSLHPLLVRRLIDMFQSSETNPHGAQLIFSTHNTSFLDTNVLRRDQIWFTEKNNEQATTLYPLIEFSPRKTEALERGYLMGRYGAVPFFRDPI
jgi:uncharacterized protein